MTGHTQHHDALAEAVKERRQELGLSQQSFSQMSRDIDRKVNHSSRKKPGIGTTAILSIERGTAAKRQPHTLRLIDQVLRWPEGTAAAILHGDERPDGPIAPGLDEDNGLDEVASAVELARSREEVATLRREVAELASRVHGFEKTLQQLLDTVEGR